MYKYSQLKRFHHDRLNQVYMYVDKQTIPVHDHFTDTKRFVVNNKKM